MTSSIRKENYTLPIAMMFALFFMIAFVTGLPSPMGVIISKQFGASNFESQLGFFATFIAYAFMGIPAGIMLKKWGYKVTALTAVLVGFTGVGIQFLSGEVESFGIYLTGAFISGFSMCLLNTVANPMLNTLGGEGKKGNQLLQFGGSLNSVGATITPVLIGYLMGPVIGRTIEKSNPALFIAMGIFAVVFFVLLFIDIPEPHLGIKSSMKGKDPHSPLSFRHFVLGAIAIFTYVGIEVGIPSTLNLFMTSPSDIVNGAHKFAGLGIDATIAGTVVGTYWFLMLIGRLMGGFLGSKYSSKRMLSVASLLGLLFIILAISLPRIMSVDMPVFKSDLSFGFANVPISVMFFVLCGICTSVMWGGIFNLAVEGLGKYTAAASGIFMVMVCGGGIIPLFQGYVADLSGYISSYWVMFVCLAYLLYYALVGCKNVNKDIAVV